MDARKRPPSLRGLAQSIPEECYENPTSRGLLYVARDLALFCSATGLLLATNSVPIVLAGWILAALSIAALFVIGHDAAHGSLFKSRDLNYLAGQLAMLPSLHVFSCWAYGHNRVHHAFPGCQGLDFVWHPVTVEDYREMSPWLRLRHRLEWSRLGAGIYYAREIWWGRLMRMPGRDDRMRAEFRRDRLAVLGYMAVMTVVVCSIGWGQSGTVGGTIWAWSKVLLVPWLLWNCIAGWAVYIQHISPDAPWRTRRRWRKFAGQVETTCNLRMPRWFNFFLHNIFLHVPHHVDPRIPFYHLPMAAEALDRENPEIGGAIRYRFGTYVDSTRHCKLFDFEGEVWTDYPVR